MVVWENWGRYYMSYSHKTGTVMQFIPPPVEVEDFLFVMS